MKLQNTITMLMLLVVACTQAQQGSILSVADFEKQVTAKTEKVVLDVRTPNEFKGGHLAEATLMNVNDSNFKQQISTLQKKQTRVCVLCSRSKK
jgi:thioredoxin 1